MHQLRESGSPPKPCSERQETGGREHPRSQAPSPAGFQASSTIYHLIIPHDLSEPQLCHLLNGLLEMALRQVTQGSEGLHVESQHSASSALLTKGCHCCPVLSMLPPASQVRGRGGARKEQLLILCRSRSVPVPDGFTSVPSPGLTGCLRARPTRHLPPTSLPRYSLDAMPASNLQVNQWN